jgi:flavin reductase (DIM6/NTAB) family NADH-FMN oxidoreductase RutF
MQRPCEPDQAIQRKYPESVVLVTTRGSDGTANVMAVGWVAVASGDPLMFVLGIADDAVTFRLIRETRQFVVAFPHEGMAAETLYAGTHHGGPGRDKLAEAGLRTQPGTAGRAPLVADAVANFECELVDVVTPGDCPLVIGRVLAAHAHTDPSLRRLYTVGAGHRMAGVRPCD